MLIVLSLHSQPSLAGCAPGFDFLYCPSVVQNPHIRQHVWQRRTLFGLLISSYFCIDKTVLSFFPHSNWSVVRDYH